MRNYILTLLMVLGASTIMANHNHNGHNKRKQMMVQPKKSPHRHKVKKPKTSCGTPRCGNVKMPAGTVSTSFGSPYTK